MTAEGTVYLLHFERPYKGKMRHYLGWTSDLERRLANHRQGTACATTKLAFDRGIGFVLACSWPGTVRLERRIKRRGVVNCCVICSPNSAATAPRPT
jgi:predicted GIY-YIG superfamily endonuclease